MNKGIPLSIPYLKGNEWKYLKKCLDTNWISMAGPDIAKFENKFAHYIGSKYAVAVQSGTAAIHLALKTLGVNENDVVLVPSLTFIASVNPIKYCLAEPVFIDSCRDNLSIDEAQLENKIIELLKKNIKPKAVIVVHLYGHCAEIECIVEICRKYNIKIIEDATEALGSIFKGKKVGTFGDIGCFSFNGNKLITTGGGGMVVTENKKYAKQVKYLSTQAKDDSFNYIHNEIGYNYRMSNLQASLGLAQLEQIEKIIELKQKIADFYNKNLDKVPGLTLVKGNKKYNNCNWLYCLLVDKNKDHFLKKLNKKNILARPFWSPIHTMKMYKNCDRTDMRDTMFLWRRGINLPSSASLTEKELYFIVKTIKETVE